MDFSGWMAATCAGSSGLDTAGQARRAHLYTTRPTPLLPDFQSIGVCHPCHAILFQLTGIKRINWFSDAIVTSKSTFLSSAAWTGPQILRNIIRVRNGPLPSSFSTARVSSTYPIPRVFNQAREIKKPLCSGSPSDNL